MHGPTTTDDAIDPAVHERRWITLGVLCLSLLIIVMDNTILIIEGPADGWTHATVIAAFAVAIVGGALFVWWELHTPHPMLQMTVFRNARFSAASLTITFVFFALFGSLFLMTQYWQLVHGYTPLQAGVRLLPQAATMMIVAPTSARLVERLGTKRVVLLGLTLITTGLLLLSTLGTDTRYPVVISFLIIMSAGMGMTMAPATESVMGSLPRDMAGVGSAINDTTRQVGGAVGVAIIGSIASSIYAGKIDTVAANLGLDAAATSTAESSLGAAQKVAAQLGGAAQGLVSGANQAFVDSMTTCMIFSACIIAATAVFAWRCLPAHAAAPGRDDLPAASPGEFAQIKQQ